MVKVKHPPTSGGREIQVSPKNIKREGKKNTQYALWFVAVISFLFFVFALSYLFLEAVVTVNPKIVDMVLNENLSASQDGSAEKIPFDLIVISGEEDKIVQATEKKDVSEKAQGAVLIYNAFGSAAQMLSIDTRLLGSNGKIYKTKKQIFVPGMKGDLPGSIEVGIYGTEAGEEYNSGPLDFTILGFKGTPKYSKFYARSKGEITGGFKGKTSVVSEAQKLAVTSDMRAVLQTKLFKKATDQIPNGFVLFKDAVFLNIDDNNIDLVFPKDEMLSVKLKGTLYGLLFDEDKLTKKIAENNIKNYDDSAVYLPNIRDLAFSMLNKDNISFWDVKNVDFNLSGTAKIVWRLDESKLISDLLGKSKKDFSQILLQYPNIDSADLAISPFWKMSFPDKIKDLKVIVNYPPHLSF